MNTHLPSQHTCSPLSSGGKFEDVASSDSPTNSQVACLPQKRKAGRKKFKETRHPIFRGVRERDGGKWVCEVREPNKKSRIWLGTYPSAELAARAYDVAALALRGDDATLNFTDSAWLTPRAKSTSARDIRVAASQATRSDFRSSGNKSGVEDESSSSKNSNGVKEFEENVEEADPKELFLDEEAIFNMPTFFDSMAAGMLLTPPSLMRGINWDDVDNKFHNCYIDLDLW